MIVPEKYSSTSSLRDKIIYVISVLKSPTPDEVAMEIMELQGISTEDGVADLRKDTAEELKRLCAAGLVVKVKEHHKKTTYILST
jgi:hypothetical protein